MFGQRILSTVRDLNGYGMKRYILFPSFPFQNGSTRTKFTLLLFSILLFSLRDAMGNISSSPRLKNSKPGDERLLLQTYGTADVIEKFDFALDKGQSSGDVEFVQSSSNLDVLKTPGAESIFKTSGINSVNLTVSLSFDNLPGITFYTLSARKKGTADVLASAKLKFTVVGMALFHTHQNGTKNILSGLNREGVTLDYKDAMKPSVSEDNKIFAFIQYADGSSSVDMSKTLSSLPIGGTLVTEPRNTRGQFKHNSSTCDSNFIRAYNGSSGISFEANCGYGFYRDENNTLCFGFKFIPYRVGAFKVHFTWPGLSAAYVEIAEETFETSIKINIIGSPPVVVTNVAPSDQLFRYEGGEPIKLSFFNADIRNISNYRLRLLNNTNSRVIPGTLTTPLPPSFNQDIQFILAPGNGTELPVVLEYTEFSPSNINLTLQEALMLPPQKIGYDERPLNIEAISPNNADDQGGAIIKLIGYFASFKAERDTISFSGFRINPKEILAASETEIAFKAPAKSQLGESYEHEVSVTVGYGNSNKVRFFYIMRSGSLRISQSGTSKISDGIFLIGDCTPATFTAIVEPLTKQILSYEWKLAAKNDSSVNLFVSKDSLRAVNRTLQTIELSPEQFGATGDFLLSVSVPHVGTTLKHEILLKRENVISIGAFLLDPPERSLSSPDAPLTLTAIVQEPGPCYLGNQGMSYEWVAFGEMYTFSTANITSELKNSTEISPSRLGRELVIPKTNLKAGIHKITFKVQMISQPSVFGYAETQLNITESPLVPVIRTGEGKVEINSASDFYVYGTNSYDPDIVNANKSIGLTYKWECRESRTSNFSTESSEVCSQQILSDSDKELSGFVVSKDMLQSLGEGKHLKFELTVAKGTARSPQKSDLYVKICSKSKKKFFADYSLTLQNSEGSPLLPSNVPVYEQIVLAVKAPEGMSWSYEMVDPPLMDFQMYDLLIQSSLYYSPEAQKTSIVGNRKPLGIEKNKLNSFSTYNIKVLFAGTADYESTPVIYTFKTAETPRLGLLQPIPQSGSTATNFTANAGVSQQDDQFSFYFLVTDEGGNTVCIGGCTGYDVVHFRLTRPGNYTLSVSLWDKRGKSLLDKKTLTTPITVSQSGLEKSFQTDLSKMFVNGDDASWTQLANDLALCALDKKPKDWAVNMLLGGDAIASSRKLEENDPSLDDSVQLDFKKLGVASQWIHDSDPGELQLLDLYRQESSASSDLSSVPEVSFNASPSTGPDLPEPTISPTLDKVLQEKREKVLSDVAKGSRSISCNSIPNVKHGRAAIVLASRVLSYSTIDRETLLDCLFVILCSVENAPLSSGIDAEGILPVAIADSYRHAETIDASGMSRSRLRDNPVSPGNLVSDIVMAVGRLMVRANAAGKLDGYRYAADFGGRGQYGHIALFAGSNALQLQGMQVNGIRRRVVKGRSSDELFYILPSNYDGVFRGGDNARRYIALYTVPNFIVKSKLQDSPAGTNLGDSLYWVQIYENDLSNDGLKAIAPTSKEPSFCMRLPVLYNREFFKASVELMPGMYACQNWKGIGVNATKTGEFFNYVYYGMKTLEYNLTNGWLEACHVQTSLFGATAITKSAGKIIAIENARLYGQQKFLIVGIVLGGLLLVVGAIASSWMIASNSNSNVAAAPVEEEQVYLERDIYGRGTILERHERARRAGSPPPSPPRHA